ncbi:hypothetical protein OTU49_013266 [Cherax quadricarinatus]|uniref:C-type lectin domain-containing protein n=1 Tax=Cherax quadricarinatus TaxID=27406 RepID=A0AAW0VTV1_CHEQU
MVLRVLMTVLALSTIVGQAQQLSTFLKDPLVEEKEEKKCPTNWFTFKTSCYKFIRSPVKTREQARAQCQAYGEGSDLVSVSNKEEHGFITRHLHEMELHFKI